jgi:hypothetical protein
MNPLTLWPLYLPYGLGVVKMMTLGNKCGVGGGGGKARGCFVGCYVWCLNLLYFETFLCHFASFWTTPLEMMVQGLLHKRWSIHHPRIIVPLFPYCLVSCRNMTIRSFQVTMASHTCVENVSKTKKIFTWPLHTREPSIGGTFYVLVRRFGKLSSNDELGGGGMHP